MLSEKWTLLQITVTMLGLLISFGSAKYEEKKPGRAYHYHTFFVEIHTHGNHITKYQQTVKCCVVA